MINEPFEPISEPRACGWPYHGFFIRKRVGGVIEQKIIYDGVERDLPAGVFTHLPQSNRESHKIRNPAAPKLDLTNEEKDSERENGRVWLDYALIAGQLGHFYGVNRGVSTWIAMMPDGRAWRVAIAPTYSVAKGYYWIIEFSRYRIGPVVPSGTGLSGGLRSFSMTFSFGLGDYYDTTTAQAAYSAGASYLGYGVSDISVDGRHVAFFSVASLLSTTHAVSIPGAAELDSLGIALDTAAGEYPVTYNSRHLAVPMFDASDPELSETRVTTSSYCAARKNSYPYQVSNIRFTEASVATLTSAEYSTAYEDVTVDGLNGGYTIYRCFTIPDRSYRLVADSETLMGFGEGIDETLVRKVHTEIDVVMKASGRLCVQTFQYAPTGSGPMPAPDSITYRSELTINERITFGDNEWFAQATETRTDSSVGNTTWYGNPTASVIAPGYSGALIRKDRPEIDNFLPIMHPTFYPAPAQRQPGDAGDWDSGNYDFSISPPVTIGIPDMQAAWYRPEILATDLKYSPAAATIPKGTYYKGKYINSFLPKYNKVWAINPVTYEMFIADRAPTGDADGYIYATFI